MKQLASGKPAGTMTESNDLYMIDSYSVRIVDIQHSNIRLVVDQFKGRAPGQSNVRNMLSKKIMDENKI